MGIDNEVKLFFGLELDYDDIKRIGELFKIDLSLASAYYNACETECIYYVGISPNTY